MSFLADLKEPIVPKYAWAAFLQSMDLNSTEKPIDLLKGLITGLPEGNRVTLKYILRHLQQLSKCPYAKMNLGNAASLFAPLLLGYTPEPLEKEVITEIVLTMLKLPTDFLEV